MAFFHANFGLGFLSSQVALFCDHIFVVVVVIVYVLSLFPWLPQGLTKYINNNNNNNL